MFNVSDLETSGFDCYLTTGVGLVKRIQYCFPLRKTMNLNSLGYLITLLLSQVVVTRPAMRQPVLRPSVA